MPVKSFEYVSQENNKISSCATAKEKDSQIDLHDVCILNSQLRFIIFYYSYIN